MRRSLIYFWRINLAVLFGAAVATSVLTGALLVGDSVRGSLRDLTLDRLGKIDHAMISHRYFRQTLTGELAQSPAFQQQCERVAPAVIMDGNVVHAKSKSRASRVNILGVDERFTAFFPGGYGSDKIDSLLQKQPGQLFSSIIINQSLQDQLQAEIGDQILLSFEKPSDIARGSVLGHKDTEDIVETTRFTLTAILPDEGIGRFGLRANQTLPLNAYVALPVLQRATDQPGRINALLVSQNAGAAPEDVQRNLERALKPLLTPADLGLKLTARAGQFILESEESILSPQIVALTDSIVKESALQALRTYTYLANAIEAGKGTLPYSTVTALDLEIPDLFGTFELMNGSPAPVLRENQILLNTWAAGDLGVQPGDTVSMSYFTVGPRDDLITARHTFDVVGIVRMNGLAADRSLTPDYPGISDATSMADWDPPFPIDLGLIRPKDEVYWDAYRGTPKAFVSWETGQRLWGSRFGSVTAFRLADPGKTGEQIHALFEKQLLERLAPAQFGFSFQPVKQQGLTASQGATDFGGLFIGFSMFLIAAAALLVGLLFRLGVERRAAEIGTLLAIGFPLKRVRRQFMQEGGFIAAIGALLGLGGAISYAWIMMFGLRTWWVEAVGSPFLFLHVTPLSLVSGYAISILVILLSIWLGFRKLSKLPVPLLVAGVTALNKKAKRSRRLQVIAYATLAVAILMSVSAVFLGVTAAAGLFFGVGAVLLISGLSFFLVWLRSPHHGVIYKADAARTLRMAARNSPRNPGRSMLSAALVAAASFVIVAVGANRRDFGAELLQKESGAGGFALMAQSDIPLLYDLNSRTGRIKLGFSDEDAEALDANEIIPLRLRPGEDASCLNLYQVERPRILGVPQTQIQRGGFTFSATIEREGEEVDNPWRLLNREMEPGVIPAFGDANSVQWILHSGLNQDLVMTDETGREIRLRFAGLIAKSIFQSEVLISEANFLKHFPGQAGYSSFLIECEPDRIEQTGRILESSLSDYGFDVTTTAEKLASFQAVENTYLSTFQTLGGLGLLLGTLGLGIILIRNVIERRGELATLRAFGYRKGTLAVLVLAENGFLLGLGIFIGTVSAVIAVAPHVLTASEQIPWGSLVITLLLVFAVGMLASAGAVSAAIRIPLLPALKSE